MKKPFNAHITIMLSCTLLACSCVCLRANAQQEQKRMDTLPRKVVVAGSEYSRSGLHNWLWGRHYRPEWVTPIQVELLNLDTLAGGLKPYRIGGGRQSKTLRLRNPDSKEFVMRSVNKSFGRALPDVFRKTFVEKHINDQVSIAHPYSAITIPPMAKAAGIYHTEPIIRFVPKQPALDTFNDEFGNNLYIVEQRPDENWEEAGNLANSTNIISTENFLKKLLSDNDNLVNQEQYVKARLFDMFIGDWGRHEDQWRWAKTEKDGKNIYQPIPRDRDQAYTKFDGALLRIVISSAGLKHMEGFGEDIKDVRTFNFPARNLDRRMANAASLEVWTNAATELQNALTDAVIEQSIRLLPPEVFNVSGKEIIHKLKARRAHLVEFATDYYEFLAEEVDIPGTEKHEHFIIDRINDKETKVSIHKIKKSGEVESQPSYQRVFHRDETAEIRLYGIAGNDTWEIKGDATNYITVRIIGGKDKDVIKDLSAKGVTHVYDDKDNIFEKSSRTKLHLSRNDTIHAYRYDAFKYDRKVFRPMLFFSNYDRFYAGLSYTITNQGWRKEPFASRHSLYARYSITQNAVSFGYLGIKEHMIGNWDLFFNVDYDAIRWTNFFGIGNETAEDLEKDRDYYRVRTREIHTGLGLNRQIGQSNNLRFTPFISATRVINDPGRLLADNVISIQGDPNGKSVYQWDKYAGVALDYNFTDLDDPVIPMRGLTFGLGAAYTKSLESVRSINTFTGKLNFYIPLTNHVVLAVRNGGATVTGDPKFYQLNAIGGSQNLRGYRRDRFRGRTAFFNNTELQYLFDFKSYLFNGKAGFVGFYDIGRVWHPNESSNVWHRGYGAGITIAPFNKAMFSVTYGLSKENKLVHLRLSRML
ncbi:MAG TPA: hypothetical protein VD993_02400 [Chitinophagaceae bacterium]|nr:hypothetical protein [Chitinophagaceae bacterium]